MNLTQEEHEQIQKLLQELAQKRNITISNNMDINFKTECFYFDIIESIEDYLNGIRCKNDI